MRPADLHQSVADSLQADVMRFMAIIAFCLIAILALVRSVAPAEQRTETAAAPELPTRSAAPGPKEPLAPSEPAPPAELEEPVAMPVERETIVEPAPAPEPAPAAAPDPRPAPVPEPAQAGPAEPQPRAEPEQTGLSLRFASEQDFLRLVNRGRIQVFAFNGDEVLSLDTDFSFRPVPAPGEVHELLPETIPDLMAGALVRSHGEGYRWGVAMPEAMARQIRRYVNDGATGELIIDRFGEVRHRGV
jgi:hypothetical protein